MTTFNPQQLAVYLSIYNLLPKYSYDSSCLHQSVMIRLHMIIKQ